MEGRHGVAWRLHRCHRGSPLGTAQKIERGNSPDRRCALSACALELGIGRIGNFINQELYGTATTLPWGISIPGVEGLRHPVQLYEMSADFLIAALCFWHLARSSKETPGRVMALFLSLYSPMRFLMEFLKVHEHSLINVGIFLSREQLLTVPLFFVGLALWRLTKNGGSARL